MTIECCLTIAGGRLYWKTQGLDNDSISVVHDKSRKLCGLKEQERVTAKACTFVPDLEHRRVLLSWVDFNQRERDGDKRPITTFRWHLVISIDEFRSIGLDPFALARCAFFRDESEIPTSLRDLMPKARADGAGQITAPLDPVNANLVLPIGPFKDCAHRIDAVPDLDILTRAAEGELDTLYDYLAALVAGLAGDLIIEQFPVHGGTPFDQDAMTDAERLLRSLYLALPYEARLRTRFSTYLSLNYQPEYKLRSKQEAHPLIAFDQYRRGLSFKTAMLRALEQPRRSAQHRRIIAAVRSEYVLLLATELQAGKWEKLKRLQEEYRIPPSDSMKEHDNFLEGTDSKRFWPLILLAAFFGAMAGAGLTYVTTSKTTDLSSKSQPNLTASSDSELDKQQVASQLETAKTADLNCELAKQELESQNKDALQEISTCQEDKKKLETNILDLVRLKKVLEDKIPELEDKIKDLNLKFDECNTALQITANQTEDTSATESNLGSTIRTAASKAGFELKSKSTDAQNKQLDELIELFEGKIKSLINDNDDCRGEYNNCKVLLDFYQPKSEQFRRSDD